MATRRSQVDVTVGPAGMAAGDAPSYVDWGAVIAGAILASAISLVFLAFGSAIGLSMASPFRGEGASKAVFAIALALWVLWVVVSSFLAGGYLAGRMRRRIGDATEHEVEVRDGAHGLVVWALGVLLAAALTAAGVSGVLRGGAEAARTVASSVAGAEGGGTDPVSMAVDALFRSTGQGGNAAETEAAKGEVRRILATSAVRGDVSPDDRAYIVRLVAARTGVAPADAERRINEVLGNARRAADDARKAGVLIGFLTAAALLAGAAAAWWGATTGGEHRDRQVDFSRFMRRR